LDLERIRDALPEAARPGIDLKAAWLRYRAEGGLDEDDAFEAWLAERYPAAYSSRMTGIEHVEVSGVLPRRFAASADPDAGELKSPAGVNSARAPASDPGRTHRIDPNSSVADYEAETVIMMPEVAQPPPDVETMSDEEATLHGFHYKVIGTAGRGGMGVVHIARDSELLRRVALKLIRPEASRASSTRLRFLREAQITAQLDHPNIVPVYALELAPGGTPAYTMKLVQGKTFLALIDEACGFFECKQRPDEARTLAARLEHFLKVCDAVAYAHDKGVIHRDLKPANLMLGAHNEVYVMDWGLCRALRADVGEIGSAGLPSPSEDSGPAQTELGVLIGTPRYMAPEQAQGRNDELDARSDQYALGLILQELATLTEAIGGKMPFDVLTNAAEGKRRAVAHAYLGARAIPRDLVAIIDKACAPDPVARYPSVVEFGADLRRYLRSEAVHARPDNVWRRTARAIGRHRQRVLTGILALVAVSATAIGLLLWQNQRQYQIQQVREQRLLQLRDSIDAVGNRVQTRMLQLEGGIENLAEAVAQSEEFGAPVQDRFYTLDEFRSAANAPPDLVPSADLGGRVSLNWAVWTLPSGMDRASALPTIRKLAALQPFRRELYRRTAVMIAKPGSDLYAAADADTIVGADGNAVNAIVIGLESGIASRFPGWDGMPEGYDPRERPWYVLAKGETGPQWGEPYFSKVTHRSELPVSVPLRNAAHEFLGVVSAQLAPDKLVRSLLAVSGEAAIRNIYLLDRSGHVLAAGGAQPVAPDGESDTAEAPLFPQPELLRRLNAHRTGIFEAPFAGSDTVFASSEIDPLGWSVVAVADPKVLFEGR